ncbi:MAG TPA: carbohydrate kinase family protein [Candidatus Brocadiia bacterium]|nr:carbohydrate kinase family protein [Candidatus Brocadiia bacterium]
MIDAVVAGHICLDMIPAFPPRRAELSELFSPGRLTQVGELVLSTGGTVSNTGLALHRLGARVKLMGKVGRDQIARIIEAILKSKGADCAMSVSPGEPSSYSFVLAPTGHDRMFLHCPGTNDTFTSADVDYSVVAQARLFHYGYPTLMSAMFANEGEELLKVMKTARETGATTSLDVSLPDEKSPAGQAPWERILARTLPYVDLFMPSVDEAIFMLSRQRWLALRERGATSRIPADDVVKAARKALGLGAGAVVIKCGSSGIMLAAGDEHRLAKMGKTFQATTATRLAPNTVLWQEAMKAERMVSALGAGDCAVAGFLAAVLRGLDPVSCLRMASAAGAKNVEEMDATSGVRSWEDVSELAGGNWTSMPSGLDGNPAWGYDTQSRIWLLK